MAGRGSAAVQIVRPPSSPAKRGNGGGQAMLGDPKDGNKKLCRNVLIYGSCKFKDQGCTYSHPDETITPPASQTALPAISPLRDTKPFYPASSPMKEVKSGLGADSLAAPVFVPKTPLPDSSPRAEAATLKPTWPVLSEGDGSSMQQSMSYDGSLGMEMESMYIPQNIRQPLDYHLYTSPLPHVAPPANQHPLHSFFIPDDLRRYLQARQDATYSPSGSSPGLPAEVGVYHGLTLLGVAGPSHPSKVYGHPAPVYRAVSTVDGSVYSLRRIEGYKLVNEAAFGAIDTWRRMRHPNIVGLREAFTTKAFGDNSLVLVYDFHPNSSTVWEEHMAPDQAAPQHGMPRRRAGMPIQERVLWTYITQIANALKAIHSSNLAARNLDPSKVLITGKNRVRLNGCGILDVLAYDATTPVGAYQQEDLVSFGKLVISMCCEFFQPGQHPAGPLDHIARNYTPDVKNLVLFLISKPSPMKSIDDVIRMLGVRLLNEMDAIQNYTDVLESELGGEIENGRLVRLMIKLGFINERAEFELDPRWSDTGDRYILKLFRDYVFHSVGVDGKPVLDLSHVLTALNKLDAGLDERVMLVSRDDQSCLVVSYREIKGCIEAAMSDLRNSGGMMRR